MCVVCRISDRHYVCINTVLQEFIRLMGAVTVQQKKTQPTCCFLLCLSVKVLNPFHSEFTICPAFTLICQSVILISIHIKLLKLKTHVAPRGLFCSSHFTLNAVPLKMISGGIDVPSAQIVHMTVVFSRSTPRTWCCTFFPCPPTTCSFSETPERRKHQ